MEFVKKLNYKSIVDFLHNAQEEVFWVSPSLTVEIAYALTELTKSGIRVSVLTDINADRFRHYEGEFSAVEILVNNSDLTLKKARNLGLGFIIADRQGYAFFSPLRGYEQDGDRYNAFKLDENSISPLISHFFESEEHKHDIFESSEAEQLKQELHIESVQPSDIEETKEELKKDPPLRLDLKRLINVYRSQFQIVEIKFPGSNLHIKKIKLPKNALPFTDTRLKNSIESQLRLFDDIPKKDFFQPFFDVKEDYEILRASFVTYIKTREKNIIKKNDKPAFEIEFNQLVSKVLKVKDILKSNLQEEIIKTKAAIRDSLKQFFINNPTETLSELNGETLEQGAEQEANDIVGRIHFPSAKKLLENLRLEKFYYDLTWEDLKDREVIEEFKEKRLITEDEMSNLIIMSQAYEINTDE